LAGIFVNEDHCLVKWYPPYFLNDGNPSMTIGAVKQTLDFVWPEVTWQQTQLVLYLKNEGSLISTSRRPRVLLFPPEWTYVIGLPTQSVWFSCNLFRPTSASYCCHCVLPRRYLSHSGQGRPDCRGSIYGPAIGDMLLQSLPVLQKGQLFLVARKIYRVAKK
jgi:hypothetical protein